MPVLNEMKRGKEIGKSYNVWHIWLACPACGEGRWIQFIRGSPINSGKCRQCWSHEHYPRGAGHPSWKGGRINANRYIMVWLDKNDFFYPMTTKDGYVMEHRLIMAKHLDRCLLLWEVVHHKNGIRDDNRLENLELLPTNKQHLSSIKIQAELKKRDKRIAELEKRVTLLEAENAMPGNNMEIERILNGNKEVKDG